jgi:hypothetical protein
MYYCNARMGLGRLSDKMEQKVAQIVSKWEVDHSYGGGNGNLKSELIFNKKTKKVEVGKTDFTKEWRKQYSAMWELLPSCLALYRLIALFQKMATDQHNDWYKVIWSFGLKHKATGAGLCFGEFKAGFSFWTEFMSADAANKKAPGFFEDLCELLELLASQKVPHTYDGTVAGSVA